MKSQGTNKLKRSMDVSVTRKELKLVTLAASIDHFNIAKHGIFLESGFLRLNLGEFCLLYTYHFERKLALKSEIEFKET